MDFIRGEAHNLIIVNTLTLLLQVHARECGQHQRAGDVRDLGAGRGQAGGGVRQPQSRGPHQLLLRLPAARVQLQAGERRGGDTDQMVITSSFPAGV